MRFLSFGVMIYMLLALIWWTILLSKNNTLLYDANKEMLQLTQNQLFGVKDFSIETTSEYKVITDNYLRTKFMILGEGMVFGISLILGLWFIQKAYSKELENTRKQKNFLLSITHELKSPIASINLITETLLKRQLSSEKITDLHHSILSESNRLEKLINNLLLTTRINNRYQYNFESVDIVEIISEVVNKVKLQYSNASITTQFSTKKMYVSADKEAMISLITNLIENACKYSIDQAAVNVSVKTTTMDMIIEVMDQGVGISNLEKAKVTGQFYRSGNEELRQTKGTGLGLYIVEKITHAHRGKLKISDNHPKGTIFSISLPLKHA
ncbi:MAG: HAMP domain-containing histidine kinase [Saprospiraceae bacterium]|nr:HAMP domain-containing histidine kinase [Saprospiraceae bacterium]